MAFDALHSFTLPLASLAGLLICLAALIHFRRDIVNAGDKRD
jgi:hypothetical protein